MAESICRALRDGALQGELAPALTIKDSINSPFGFHAFAHVLAQLLSNILAGKSQSRGLVLLAFSRSPAYYVELLKKRGLNVGSSTKWIQILDCYTDPLGWKQRFMEGEKFSNFDQDVSNLSHTCTNVRDMDELFSSIITLGKGFVGEGTVRFCVAIDSVTDMLRHSSTSALAGLLSGLRSNDSVSSTFWLVHEDLHEEKVIAAVEYMSSIVAMVEGLTSSPHMRRSNLDNSYLEHSSTKGRFHVRIKRRNGRVRVICEDFNVEPSGIKFTSISSEDAVISQGLIPKVQFNLQLSEKERNDRARVVLPFEHQGNGEPIQIYDGRRSLPETKDDETPLMTSEKGKDKGSGKGEIVYFRDSDDEMPDSDEDPDDDLDI
ncbi:elongator complex protein 5 isoform X2 [Benincasa hispida]|uniref:elongator complex protein 5 isoform X2 n=1 Tax=Benincasa hispida TaxID=102211 RepID=UPI0018FF3E34|nr:elongator complex protein 5 isoform X2 [Benincasa hispida]